MELNVNEFLTAKSRDYVMDTLDRRTLLEAFAEEAAELSQASLKLIRAEGLSNNVTPKGVHEATMDLVEELMDVMSIAYLLGMSPDVESVQKYTKWNRWAKRLRDSKEGDGQ